MLELELMVVSFSTTYMSFDAKSLELTFSRIQCEFVFNEPIVDKIKFEGKFSFNYFNWDLCLRL